MTRKHLQIITNNKHLLIINYNICLDTLTTTTLYKTKHNNKHHVTDILHTLIYTGIYWWLTHIINIISWFRLM